jgi:hypothetical protein
MSEEARVKGASLSDYLERSAAQVETLEKSLYQLKTIGERLCKQPLVQEKDHPDEQAAPTTFIERAQQLSADLERVSNDIHSAISKIESVLG